MKFDQPATQNPIDQQKFVGQPLDRIDGPLKVTGAAPYAYDRHDVIPNQAYGYVVGAGIAKGRVSTLDVSGVQTAPGVLAVVTYKNAGKLGKGRSNTAALLGGPQIDHYHQAIALVVAETFEQARDAAHRIKVEYIRESGRYDLDRARDGAKAAPFLGEPGESAVGNFAFAFSSAPVQLDVTYHTAHESHAMIEPHTTVAAWNGDELTVWTSNQMIDRSREDLATILGIAKAKVRLSSPYIGGGFGAKLWPRADLVLAALGARAAKRPVKVALTRAITPNNTVHRSATVQRIRLGATPDGKLTAIAHECWSADLPKGKPEAGALQTRSLYAGEHRMTANLLAVLDLPEQHAMRAPGEAPGMAALEVAMDELAERLGMDPIELRVINDTQIVPDVSKGAPIPFSQRQLVQCLQTGAKRFGWEKRNPKPGQVREGRWLIGLGVAAAIRNNLLTKSGARVRLDRTGLVTVETDMTDIGTGSYTIIAQTAAEMMGVALDQVRVRLGESTFPPAAGSGGQWGANCATSGVYAACMKMRELVAQKTGMNPSEAIFSNGQVRVGSRSVPLRDAASDGPLVVEDFIEFGELATKMRQASFGAHFAEVAVDAATCEVRVRRMLAVCAAGRILNPKTARSQVIGAMAMGVGAALMEELVVDKRQGFFVNHDLAGYEVPVHADIPYQEVIFINETDPQVSPMKAKGIGELGICGTAAAISNAIYNATGVRVRDYPITLDKLLDKVPLRV